MRGRTCGRGLGRVYPIKKNPPVPLTGMSEFYTWGCEAPIQTEAYISHLIGSSSTAFDVKNRWRLNDRPSFGQEVRVPHSALLQLIIASAVVDDAVGARAVFIVSCAARKTRSPRDRRLERAVSSYHFFCDTKWLFVFFCFLSTLRGDTIPTLPFSGKRKANAKANRKKKSLFYVFTAYYRGSRSVKASLDLVSTLVAVI